MYRKCTLLVLAVLVCGVNLSAQRPPPRPSVKRTAKARPAVPTRVPNYLLNIRIAGGGKYFVSVASPAENGLLRASDLNSLITDLPAGADKYSMPNKGFPKVAIEVSPNVAMLDLWNPITLFRLDRTDITVYVPGKEADEGDIPLKVLRTRLASDLDFVPNPLLLIVTCDETGKLSLNNEPAGTMAEVKPLSSRLQEVFKQRETTGVFRVGLNEVEKSVTIVMPMSERKVSDLFTIARAIREAGGDIISLIMENPFAEFVEKWEPLIHTAPIAPRRPNR